MALLRILDDRGRELLFTRAPSRVVSLVPSDTQNVFALGAGARLVGRTRYCVEPAQAEAIAQVGGTKDVDVDAVLALQPDLVIANQEENAKAALEKLAQAGVPVLVSFPRTVGEGIAHLARLARVLDVGADPAVRALLKQGNDVVREALAHAEAVQPLPVFVPIWMDPLMTISGDTFVSDALRLAGARNVFADRKRKYPLAADLGRAPAVAPDSLGGRDVRYPRIQLAEVEERAPEAVLLPDEPHAFTEQDAAVFRAQATPAAKGGRVRLCQGRDLMWYGARSIEGLPRLRALVDSLR